MPQTRHRSLRAYRRAKHLTQREAADQVEISQVAWSRLERGLRRPRPLLAKKLNQITGVPLTTLFGFNGTEST
jgi:transcriptional regulator with XRE-family HTH domain